MLNFKSGLSYSDQRMSQNLALLSQLGVIHRAKRYSRVFYVNPDTDIGKSNNKSDSMGNWFDRPMLSEAEALSSCESGRGDFIVCQDAQGSYLVGEDTSVAIADLTLVGQGSSWSANGFKPATTATTILSIAAAADNVLIKNLRFDIATGLTGCITTVSGAHFLKVEDCYFNVVGSSAGTGIDMTAGSVTMPMIQNNYFMLGTLVLTGMLVKAGVTGGLIKGNTLCTNLVANGTTPPVSGIKIDAGTGVVIESNYISGGEKAAATDNIATGILIADAVINSILCGPNFIGNCDAGVTNTTDTTNSNSGLTAGEGWTDISHA